MSAATRGSGRWSAVGLALALMLWTTAAHAQATIGENTKLNLTGSLGYGYSGSFGNTDYGSNHGQGVVANMEAGGYYFHPNFLNFNARTYFDRSQSNADIQGITRENGFNGSVGLFGGSHFPLSISYGKDFASNSEFQIAGVPSILGNSSGTGLGITWAALFDNMPKVYVNYLDTNSESSVLASANKSKDTNKTLTLNSDYNIWGFQLRALATHYSYSFDTPEYLTSVETKGEGSGSSIGVSAQHKLPLSGAFGLGWSHAIYSTGASSNWSNDNYNGSIGFSPWRRLSVNSSAFYTSNLAATLQQSYLGNNSPILFRSDSQTDSFSNNSSATLTLGHGLGLNGHITHNVQHAQDREYSMTQYGGTVSYHYASRFLGFLRFSAGMVDSASQEGNGGAGFVATVGMDHKFGKWNGSADFDYNHSLQTEVALINVSNYNYGGALRRKFNDHMFWALAVRESHSGINPTEGNSNRSETFSSSFAYGRYMVGAHYSQSNGTAVLTSNGTLTPTPIGPYLTNSYSLFNARSVNVSLATRFFQRLNVSGGYSHVSSDTSQTSSLATFSNGDRYNIRTNYRLRRFEIQGGYDRARQYVSTISGGARVINSYYLSLSRWFNVF